MLLYPQSMGLESEVTRDRTQPTPRRVPVNTSLMRKFNFLHGANVLIYSLNEFYKNQSNFSLLVKDILKSQVSLHSLTHKEKATGFT